MVRQNFVPVSRLVQSAVMAEEEAAAAVVGADVCVNNAGGAVDVAMAYLQDEVRRQMF